MLQRQQDDHKDTKELKRQKQYNATNIKVSKCTKQQTRQQFLNPQRT